MKTILVIDDFATARLYHCALLRQLGHQVAEAADGREALAWLARHSCDLILLDVLMPGMPGGEFLAQLRTDPQRRTLPVIAITSERQPEIQQRLIALGAATVLVKPVPPTALRAAIEAVLPAATR